MTKETAFSKMPPVMNLLLLTGLVFLGLLVTGIFTLVIAAVYTKGDMASLSTLATDLTSPDNIFLLKIMQLINSIGMFIIPALVFAYLMNRNASSFLKVNKNINLKIAALCVLIFAVVLPLIDVLGNLNGAIKLPSSMAGMENWMKQSEAEATKITEAFLNINTFGAFIFNILLIALIPALGEEFIFRGCIQKTLQDWIKNPHVAIVITAIVFSAIHLQFYGFFPRMFLGIILGYLFYWTNNLWYPIILHFINNAFSVTMYFLKNRGIFNMENVENKFSESVMVIIISTILLAVLLYIIRKQRNKLITEN